jgi:hypothetical protein
MGGGELLEPVPCGYPGTTVYSTVVTVIGFDLIQKGVGSVILTLCCKKKKRKKKGRGEGGKNEEEKEGEGKRKDREKRKKRKEGGKREGKGREGRGVAQNREVPSGL